MKELYIIRHGETDYNLTHRVQGCGIDTNLNQTGINQGSAFFEKYQSIDFELVYTSNLKRSQQTVDSFIKKGINWEIRPEIREISWGVYEGKSTKSEQWMKDKYDFMITQWGEGNFDAKLDNGESAAELRDRLNVFIEEIKQRPEQKILVCTHGRTLRCLMAILEEKHLREMENYEHSNTGLYKVNLDQDKFAVQTYNDISHL